MEETELFKCKYDELVDLARKPDFYNLLKSSAILRSFYFDGGNSLVDKILKSLDEKITFEVAEPNFGLVEIMPSTTFEYSSIDPRDCNPKFVKVFTKDLFFSMPIIYYAGSKYTVRQMIKFGANVLGGIHHDPSSKKDPDYPALIALKREIEEKEGFVRRMGILIPNVNVLQPIESISRVSISSLEEVRNKI